MELIKEFKAWICFDPDPKFGGTLGNFVVISNPDERHKVRRAFEDAGHKPVFAIIQIMRMELSDFANLQEDREKTQKPKSTGRREHERKKSA